MVAEAEGDVWRVCLVKFGCRGFVGKSISPANWIVLIVQRLKQAVKNIADTAARSTEWSGVEERGTETNSRTCER